MWHAPSHHLGANKFYLKYLKSGKVFAHSAAIVHEPVITTASVLRRSQVLANVDSIMASIQTPVLRVI